MNSDPSPQGPDLICIDAAAQSDLMFWNQLSRAFSPRPGEPPLLAPAVLLVGSGERAERAVADPLDGPVREFGSLQFPPDATVAFERSVREENKKIVFELTDAEISSVGFVAGDRKLLVPSEGGIAAGNWTLVWQSVTTGVVPVVSTVMSKSDQNWVDVDPLEAAHTLNLSAHSVGRIVVMAQRLAPSLRTALESGGSVSVKALVAEGALPAWRASTLRGGEVIHHVEWLGRTAPCRLD